MVTNCTLYFLHRRCESVNAVNCEPLTSSLHLRNLQVPFHTFHPLLVGCWFKLLTPTRQAPGRTSSIDLRACLLAPSRSDIESE
jgi:hypothetical protein